MAYEVLARKWRPQQFEDVVGQQHIARTLKNAIERDRVAHAYLFVGPRGIGKTSTARIFAKSLNCDKGPTAHPCDECDSCREIMGGHSMDVIEIDGASNNGVDQVRELRENAQYTPASGPFKIYIIDEVHMLSTAAFNALLKTLEEPPAHVKFIFATTEPQRVPATITSRCQRFDLRRIATPDIMGHLRKIADAEGIKISDDALLAIARGAEGALRDAESALDQLTAFCGEEIAEEDVLSVFGLVSRKDLEALTDAVLQGEVGEVVLLIDRMDRNGRDIKGMVFELIDHFKNLMIFMHSEDALKVLDVATPQVEVLKKQKKMSSPGRVMRVVENLLELEGRLRYALSPRTLLETSLIKSARAAAVADLDEIMDKLNSIGVETASPSQTQIKTQSETAPKPGAVREKAAPPKKKVETRPIEAPVNARTDKELARLKREWHDICDNCGHAIPASRSYLKDTCPVSVDADWVVIGIDSEFYDKDVDDIEMSRCKGALQEIISHKFGRELALKLKRVDDMPAQQYVDSSDSDESSEGKKTPREWCEDPVVQKAMKAFDGEIADLRV